MKTKCWQGKCPKGKECCCWECGYKMNCNEVCDDKTCETRKVGRQLEKKIEMLNGFVKILFVLIWIAGFIELYNDNLGWTLATAMMVAAAALLKVIIPEHDEDDF